MVLTNGWKIKVKPMSSIYEKLDLFFFFFPASFINAYGGGSVVVLFSYFLDSSNRK